MLTVQQKLDKLTTAASLVEKVDEKTLRCTACAHRCLIKPGRRGICQVRFNQDGELRVPWGYVAALQIDPVEKKPFSHFLPGSDALSFGMFGCDFHCGYCQNWLTSQTLRDPRSNYSAAYIREVTPEEIIQTAKRNNVSVLVSTYNEPLITTEWAISIFKLGKQESMSCAYVSNGNATKEAIQALLPYLNAYKIDLKSMNDKNYRQLGGVLQHVLDSIKIVHEAGLWLEVVTLVVPGFNDNPAELWDAARYIASISPDIPWHVTAYHPDYRMADRANTSARSLQTAADIGQEAGLNYVYAGNIPGRVGSLENTYCPQCATLLIERIGYVVHSYHITADGCCPKCQHSIPGIWPQNPASTRLDGWGLPRAV
ncbi:MAG: AmmeMemoRadiSam system radical SAM enzyme [Chloroflexi bacterium 44-23]|nr:MAG: AmmeMemoRadiSam system radical SAM enzyme [Chloroflexi bacterium 44-23]